MSKAAKKSALEELHEMLAEVMLEDLRQAKKDGIPLPAANLNAIRQFLKDNDVTASIEAEDMQQLKQEFKAELAAKREARQLELEKTLSDDDMQFLIQ